MSKSSLESYFQQFREHIIGVDHYFESPYGVFGKLADSLFLKKHMTKLLVTRNKLLKEKAESI